MLLKSRFVELFGDPVQNDKCWPIDFCKNLTSKIGSGATPKGGQQSYCSEGISLIRSMNVFNNYFDYTDLAHINEDQAHALDNVIIEEKDVLLNITGASVARCCLAPNDLLPARVNQHVSIIRCKERLLPEFVCSLFTSDKYQKLLLNTARAGGATREALTKQQIENLQIIIPPLEEQRKYIEEVKQLDKLKVILNQIDEKIELLKKSRFVEMFGDPVLNPYKLKKDSFRHICEELFAGGDKPSDIVLTKDETHPYPVYANGYENLGFMGFSSQCRVNKPAITISARGTIGFSCIRQAGFTPIVRLLTLIPKTGIDLDYLKFAIDFYSFTSSGTSQKQLTVPDIAKYEVLVPDYSSQQCFATFVHQLDKLKVAIHKELELIG